MELPGACQGRFVHPQPPFPLRAKWRDAGPCVCELGAGGFDEAGEEVEESPVFLSKSQQRRAWP